MSQLIDSPESWFRTRGCNYFEFRSAADQKALPPELTDWLQSHLPHRPLIALGRSQQSGWVCGGHVMRGMQMCAEDLALYRTRWEDSDGNNLDPSWPCWQWRHEDWIQRPRAQRVTAGRLPAGSQYRWLLCAQGLYCVQGTYQEEPQETDFPGEPSLDDWRAVFLHHPELQIKPDEIFLMGNDYLDHQGQRQVGDKRYRLSEDDIHYAHAWKREKTKENTQSRIRQALALPGETEVFHGFF